MTDGIIRRSIKRVALVCYMIDLKCTRAIRRLRGELSFELCGSCNGCGACCETPMIQTNTVFFRFKTTHWLILKWHRLVNGFEHVGDDRRANTLIFRCTHYDPETKLCDSYHSRPGMCRDYPRNLIYSTDPQFLKRCSYYARDKNADRMRAALEELGLPPEKLNDLKRKMHVRDE